MELPVTFDNRQLATLTADAAGIRLSYNDAWSLAPDHFPISLRMPVDGNVYGADVVLPWLMNLLPEGGGPLRAMTRVVGATAEPTGSVPFAVFPRSWEQQTLMHPLTSLPFRPNAFVPDCSLPRSCPRSDTL